MAGNLEKISKALKSQGDQLLLNLPILVMAENKWKGIAEVVKNIAVWKMIGPLGMVLGAFTGISSTVRTLLRDTGSLEAVFRRLAGIRLLEGQFRAIGSSAEAAKRKVAELVAVTERLKIFKLEEVGQAGRALEILTRGAYSGSEALTTLADSAVGTGNSLTDTAGAVGDFYADLQEGKPIAAATQHLAAMGLIGGATAARLNDLQESGAAFETIVGALGSELGRSKGAVDRQKQSIEGLQTAYDAAKESLQVKLAAPFAAGELHGIRNATELLLALGPAAESVSGYVASLIHPFESATGAAEGWIARLKGLPEVLAVVGKGLVTLAGGLLVMGLGHGIKALAEFVPVLYRIITVTGAATVATTSFGASMEAAELAALALAEGELKLAASQTIVAARSLAAGLALKAMSLIAMAIPFVAIAAAITSVVNAFMAWRDASAEATKSIDETAESSRQMVEGLREQEAAMSTLEDKVRALVSANQALTQAQKEYTEEANRPLNVFQRKHQGEVLAEKQRKVDAAREMVDSIQSKSDFAPTEAEKSLLTERAERERRMEEISFQAQMERGSPEQQMRLRAGKIAELKERSAVGMEGIEGRAQIERARMQNQGLVAEMRGAVAHASDVRSAVFTNDKMGPEDKDAASRLVLETKKNLNTVMAAQEALGSASMSAAQRHETTANQMQAGRDLVGAKLRLEAAKNAPAAPGEAGYWAHFNDVDEKEAEVDRLTKLSAGRTGTNKQIAYQRQMAAQASLVEKNASGDADRVAELTEAQKTAQFEMASTAQRLAVEKQIADLKSIGYQRAVDEWAIQRKALEDLKQQDKDRDITGKGDHNVQAALDVQIAKGDQAQSDSAREYQDAADRLDVENEILGLKSQGVQRAADEWEIRRKALEREREVNQFFRGADPNVERDLAARIKEGDRVAADARREQAAAERRLGVEHDVAGLKTIGAQRATDEWAIKRKGLLAEKEADLKAGRNSAVQIDLDNQITQGDRAQAEARRSTEVEALGVERQLAIGDRERRGDFKEARGLEDLDKFASTFEGLRATFGDDKAAEYAKQLTDNSIAQGVFNADKSGVVDSLQRIGGGGGVGAGDSALSVAQRQADLQGRMVNYLAILAAAKDNEPPGQQPDYTFGDSGE